MWLLRSKQLMDWRSFQLSLGVTKLWSLSQRARMNTGPYTSQLETFTIMSDVHIAMVLHCWNFLPTLRVSSTNYCNICELIVKHSYQGTCRWPNLLEISLSSCPHILGENPHPSQVFHGDPYVALFPDRYYHHAIYSIGPYIVNYPEQALLACIMQGWCAK